ncbi:hypothetical protein B0H17DRAFT_611326 [Mycena rosella]|uniref:Uncharacterized protein n=1 Tax=Mycena rosella TaxID=1033263 RepID=A0AAD7M914_MYCRO|nr:hypothetical protein B0H17DRAFT_611326 [Mycena rosella]
MGVASTSAATTVPLSSVPTKERKKHHQSSQNSKSRAWGRPRDNAAYEHTLARADVLAAAAFSLVEDSSSSASGWQGACPPPEARDQVDSLYYPQPRTRTASIHCEVLPRRVRHQAQYQGRTRDILGGPRRRGFYVPEFPCKMVHGLAEEVEVAHDVLVGSDATDEQLADRYRHGVRGPHMPTIIGHHRQSATVPFLAAWHVQHQHRVDKFMALPIVIRIIN